MSDDALSQTKVHIGCGKRDFGKEWYHIDGSDYPHIRSHDITKLPFEDDSLDLIYASHVLEYFDREEVINVLNEWKRCLKNGGTLRLAVPNFEAMANLYITQNVSLDRFIGPIFGKWQMTPTECIYHKTVYDYESLEGILDKVGFKNARLWDWRKTEHSHFDDYSQAYIPHLDKDNGVLISLNMEAQK